MRGVWAATKALLNFVITNLTEWTVHQAHCAALVLIEVIAADAVSGALHVPIASGYWLVINSINRAFADAFLAHGAKIPHPFSWRGLVSLDFAQDMCFSRNDEANMSLRIPGGVEAISNVLLTFWDLPTVMDH